MEIKRVENEYEANICDTLLTMLVAAEQKFDLNVKENVTVKDYYKDYYYNHDCVLFLAYVEQKPVGYIYAYLKERAGAIVKVNCGIIDALYVKTEYRNQGIASALLEAVYQWCKEKNIHKLDIRVYDKNVEAKSLYVKHNFESSVLQMSKDLS